MVCYSNLQPLNEQRPTEYSETCSGINQLIHVLLYEVKLTSTQYCGCDVLVCVTVSILSLKKEK